jgi:hypothetical protein
MDRRVRLIPIPLISGAALAIKPSSSFNNFAADLFKRAGPDIAKELLKRMIFRRAGTM